MPITGAINQRSQSGLRILRQELWETIICFIISQQNNIPRITKCVDGLCTLFGEARQRENGEVYHAFPTAERLAQCTPEELSPIRLGYRAKYICATARQVASGTVDLEKVARMKYADAKNELLRLTGVGIKVAECICLFGLHLSHRHAYPADARRTLSERLSADAVQGICGRHAAVCVLFRAGNAK